MPSCPTPPTSARRPRRALAGALAAAAVAAAAPAAAATYTLQHEFTFGSSTANTAATVTGTLGGNAVVENGVLKLFGGSDRVTYSPLIPAVSDWSTSRWSVSVWFRDLRPTGTGGSATLLSQGAYSGFMPDYTLGVRDGGATVFTLNRSGWAGGAATALPTGGGWHHAATMMFDNGAILYLDGQLVPPNPAGFYYPCCYTGQAMVIGNDVTNGAASPFTGWVDDLRIYRGALDAAEIARQYAAGPSVAGGGGPGQSVPEPGALALAAGALAALGGARRRRARRG